MAELAGSIVGLVGFAAKVSKLLCGYYGEARDAPEDIKQLASEISSLAGLLEPLSTAAEASRISQTPDSEWMSQSVHEFREILEHLEGKLPRQISEQSDSRTRRAMRSFGTHVTWPFKKGDIQKQIQKIERLKASVTMKLQLWVGPCPSVPNYALLRPPQRSGTATGRPGTATTRPGTATKRGTNP